MKILGCYEELWPTGAGKPAGSIRDFLTDEPGILEDKAADYLRRGHEIFSSMGVAEDVLGSGEVVLGGGSIHTDGEWIWRRDLEFYLLRYHLRLPEEFTEKVRTATADTFDVDDERLVEVTYEVMRILNSPKRTASSTRAEPVDWKARFPAVHRLLSVHLHQSLTHKHSPHKEAIDDYIATTSKEEQRQLVDELRILLRLAESDERLAEATDSLGLTAEPPTGVTPRQWIRDIGDIVARASA
ncbi:contact-dependent growth inhibition system immunity protein [Streptomyces taklimakanensis]|uniref:contact-dependent growth inhibition system immunity protein n=1 Tax=Streptomyces taklimakanensis TaxID=2569853 RepID=UPI0013918C96|nr:contact-dependent growth inhibition system immunity protein [Streptomyces taklimakanensis]